MGNLAHLHSFEEIQAVNLASLLREPGNATLQNLVGLLGLIIDYYRRKHKIEEYEHFLGATDWMGRYEVDGESVFSAQQTNEILERGIARLTEKRSKVYRLNLFEGMQVSEIAQSLNLGYKAAENRLTLARKEIRDYMKKELAS